MSTRATLAPLLLFTATLLAQEAPVPTPAAPGGASAAGSAERQIEALLAGARAGDAVVFWDWLPDSYRRDVEGLVHDFAGRVDPKVWARTMRLAARIGNVALDKEELFFASPEVVRAMAEAPAGMRPTRTAFRLVMTLVRDLGTSELATVDGLRDFDGRRFLRRSGGALLPCTFALAGMRGNDAMGRLESLEVRTVRQQRDAARLALHYGEQPPEVEDYVRVEGQWLPAELAADWRGAMQRARGEIRSLPAGGDRALMARARVVLGVVEDFVRRFEDVETQDEFDAVMARLRATRERGRR